MIYKPFGKTGINLSALGFGAMRLPMTGKDKEAHVDRELAIPMIHRTFEAGVNYIDSAVGYCNQDSQRCVGEALKGWRDKVIVSTKNPYYGEDEKEWWTNLENSLARLQVEYIDIYNHHGIRWERYVENVEPRVSKWMLKAKEQG
ncbi:MAG: aldo/keto reductase, partial [Firmicutes bacterium]|nr:aldo/keto reductase [Bacillota bacterium]